MKRRNSASVKALLTVSVIALLSWLALKVVNKEINPDFFISLDLAEIGGKLIQALVDMALSLFDPERKSF